jgi:hypothetical protein
LFKNEDLSGIAIEGKVPDSFMGENRVIPHKTLNSMEQSDFPIA